MTSFEDVGSRCRRRPRLTNVQRRRHLGQSAAILASVFAVLAVAACGGNSSSGASRSGGKSAALIKVTAIQGAPLINYAPVYVAQQAGYFKKEGIDLSLTTASSSSAAVQALVGGSADVSFAVTSDLLTAYKQNIPIRAVAALTNRWGFELTVSDKFAKAHGITASTPAAKLARALKGAAIGVSSVASSSGLSLMYFLREGGVASSAVTYVALGSAPSALVAALQKGTISAFWVSPPAGEVAESMKVGTIVFEADNGAIPALTSPFQVMIASTSYIAGNASTLAKVRSAIAMGEALIQRDPSEAESMVSKTFPTLAHSVVAAGFDAVLPSFATTPTIDSQRLKLVLQMMPSADQNIDVANAVGPN